MAGVWRRVAVLSAGVATLALEAVASSSANAGGLINTTQDQQHCLDVGGYVERSSSDGKLRCVSDAMDERCTQANPKFEKGERVSFMYNVNTRRCEELKCFLTAACAERAGLADDCFELSALRCFRDNVLMRMPGGERDIALYYRHAPEIVGRIAASNNPSRELARLYARYILPSAVTAWLGLNGMARRIYTRMMQELTERYGVEMV